MSEREYIEKFLEIFTDIRDELKYIADELADLNPPITSTEETKR